MDYIADSDKAIYSEHTHLAHSSDKANMHYATAISITYKIFEFYSQNTKNETVCCSATKTLNLKDMKESEWADRG